MLNGCDVCGFEDGDYSDRDLVLAPVWLRVMADQAMEGVPDAVVASAPVATARSQLEAAIGGLDPEAPDADRVHDAIHGLRNLGRAIHAAGGGVMAQQGTLHQINISDGGVPKVPVTTADITRRGVVGDRQFDRKHHGRPFQALSLWSVDVIDALRAEGHPIIAGAAGENLTVAGIDWSAVRPGGRVLIGQVLCELSAWATPCRKNDQWFLERSDRIDHERHPGWSRIYAWVVEGGTVASGDPVVIEP